jgi:hypothetical protein
VKEFQQLASVALAVIDWGSLDLLEKVNVKNLARVGDGQGIDLD